MTPRFFFTLFPLALSIAGGVCRGKEGVLEVELLRAPALTVAKILLESGDDASGEAKLRERLVKEGATVVVRCAVKGPYNRPLKYGKMKTTTEPFLFEYAAHWQTQAMEKKEGLKVGVCGNRWNRA